MLKKEELIALGVTPEQADKVIAAQTEDMKNYVPRARLDEETGKITTLNDQLSERDKDIKALKSKADKGSDFETQLTELQSKYQTETETLKAQIETQKLESALDAAIAKAGARNTKAVKALLDPGKIKLKEDGTVDGLDLDAIKKSDSYLFTIEEKKDEGPGISGAAGNPEGNKAGTMTDAIAAYYTKG